MFYLTSKFRVFSKGNKHSTVCRKEVIELARFYCNVFKRGSTMPISQAILQGKLIKYRKYNHYADKIW